MNNHYAITGGTSARASSWDQSGRNTDCIMVEPGAKVVLADLEGPGIITHWYFTMIHPNPLDYRDAVVRIYWDDHPSPSVEVPLGDLFAVPFGRAQPLDSYFASVNPGHDSLGMNHAANLYFPMPFRRRALIEIENQGEAPLGGLFGHFWYHIDYERGVELDDSAGYFHARWNRSNPTDPVAHDGRFGANLTGDQNYSMLETEGRGHIVGLHLQVDNIQGGWFGEGDDMIFIDGERWPPSLHGTGTEEIFGGGAGPDKVYASLYTGFHLVENAGGVVYAGKNAMYRWYVHDPIRFRDSVRMTIEHGHGNDYRNDYSSLVYWYQDTPVTGAALPARADRLPRMTDAERDAQEALSYACRVIAPRWQVIFSEKEVPHELSEAQRICFEAMRRYHSEEFTAAKLLFNGARRSIEG